MCLYKRGVNSLSEAPRTHLSCICIFHQYVYSCICICVFVYLFRAECQCRPAVGCSSDTYSARASWSCSSLPVSFVLFLVSCFLSTVPLLKSFHRRRGFFLISDYNCILHEVRYHYSLFHQAPIEIFLIISQKGGQIRQSNHRPPLQPPKVSNLLSRFDKYKSLYLRNQFTLIFLEYNNIE